MTKRERDNRPEGEEVNTSVMKLVKTDKELADECRDILDALIGQMAKMKTRNLTVSIGLDNGFQSGNVKLTLFRVDKELASFQDEPGNPAPGR